MLGAASPGGGAAKGESSAFVIFAWFFVMLLDFVIVVGTFIWRMLVSLGVFFFTMAQSVYRARNVFLLLLLLFSAGVAMEIYQEEVMTLADIVYECAVLPAAEAIGIVFSTVFRDTWRYLTPKWNDIILFLFDSISDVFSSLQTLQKAHQIASVSAGSRGITEAVLGGEFENIFDIIQNILLLVGDYFVAWADWAFCFLEYFTNIFNTFFVQVNMFSASCSFCSADPDPTSCTMREPFLPGQSAPDCNDCHEYSLGFFRLIGKLFDAITANFLPALTENTSFARIGAAVGCVARSFVMYPVFMVTGLFDGCIDILEIVNIIDIQSYTVRWFFAGDLFIYSNCSAGANSALCCGKPAGCTFPVDDGEDLPIGIIPCIGELILALTGNLIEDLFKLVLEFIFPIVADVVNTAVRVAECFADDGFGDCIGRYPINGAIGEPGVCSFVDGETLPPNGGIYQCFTFLHDCLAANVSTEAPLLVGIVGEGTAMQFMLTDFWQYSVDVLVCAFAQAVTCFDGTVAPIGGLEGLDAFLDSMCCLADHNPIFGPLIGAPLKALVEFMTELIELIAGGIDTAIEAVTAALAAIQGQIDDIGEVFRCMSACGIGEWLAVEEVIECLEGGEGCEDTTFGDAKIDGFVALRRVSMSLDAPTSLQLQQWNAELLTIFGVEPSSFCAGVIGSTLPTHAAAQDYGSYVTYVGCLSMTIGRWKLARKCGMIEHNFTSASPELRASDALRFYQSFPNCSDIPSRSMRNATSSIGSGRLSIPNYFNRTNTSWTFMPDIVFPMLNNLKKSSFGKRALEFSDQYKQLQRSASPQDALDSAYISFSNDVLARYRTGYWRNSTANATSYMGLDGKFYHDVTRASLVEGKQLFWDRLEELRIVDTLNDRRPHGVSGMDYEANATGNENATLRALSLGGKRSAFSMSPEGFRAWQAVDQATGVSWWNVPSTAAGIIRALRAQDGGRLMGMLRGRTKYIMNEDRFVTRTEFLRLQPKTAKTVTMAMMKDASQGAARAIAFRQRREYSIFPMPRDPDAASQHSWLPGAASHLNSAHLKYASRRGNTTTGVVTVVAPRQTADGSDTAIAIIDAIITVVTFGSIENAFETLRAELITFFGEFDFQDFSNATAVIDQFFSCTTPDNIDGTSARSPFCIMLFYENSFDLLVPVSATTSSFPTQLPWPEELITKECESPYNGNPSLIPGPFILTNNCRLPSPGVIDVQTCNPDGCMGNLTLTMNPNLQRVPDAVEITITNNADAMCDVGQMALGYPESCATVVSVVGDCVASFSTVSGSPHPGQTCTGPLTSPGLDGVLLINFNPLAGGETSCSFNVTYSAEVEVTLGPALVVLEGMGDTDCSDCALAIPAISCVMPPLGPRDLYRDCRPLCDDCDGPSCVGCGYCEREYQPCQWDVVDSILYLLGIIPVALDELIFGGIAVTTFEGWIGIPVTAIVVVALLPFILTIIGYPILASVTLNFAHLYTWAAFVLFGNLIPWPIIFLGMSVYINIRKAPWYEAIFWVIIIVTFPDIAIGIRALLIAGAVINQSERLVELFKPLFVISGLIFLIWISTLLFQTPMFTDFLRPMVFLTDFLTFLNESTFLAGAATFFGVLGAVGFVAALVAFGLSRTSVAIPLILVMIAVTLLAMAAGTWYLATTASFSGLIGRLDAFDFTGPDDILPVQYFCFHWSLMDLALVGMLGIVGGSILRLGYRGLFAVVLFALGLLRILLFALFVIRRETIFANVRKNVAAVKRNTARLNAAFARTRTVVSTNVQSVMGMVADDDDDDDDNDNAFATAPDATSESGPDLGSGTTSRKGKGKKRATSVFAGLLNAAINANGTGGADAVVDVQSVLRPKAGTTLDKSYGVTLTLAAVATFILVLATAVILTLAFVRLEWGLIALMVLLIAAPIMAYVSLVDASRGGRPGCVTCGLISVVLAVLYAIGFTIYTAAAITYIPESCAADPLCRADGAAEMDPPEVAGIPNIYYVMMTWFPLAWAIVAGIVYIWLLRDAQTSQERIISNARKATTAQQLPLGV